jgi:hypothetical protein
MKVVIAQCDTLPPVLAVATQANPTDTVVVNQSGTMANATVAQLLNVSGSINAGVTASGTTQDTGVPITAALTIFTNVAEGAAATLTLVPGDRAQVVNRGLNPLTIFPLVGHEIETLGENVGATVNPGSDTTFAFNGTNQWYAF